MKRILKIMDNQTGRIAEAEVGAWIATMVAVLTETQREALFAAIRNSVDYKLMQPREQERDGVIYKGAVFGLDFSIVEYEG